VIVITAIYFFLCYSPSPEYPAANRRHSSFGASATYCGELHLNMNRFSELFKIHLKMQFRFAPVFSLGFALIGCCPDENLFERSLKRFLLINLGEVKEKRFQLFEPEGRVLGSP